MWHRFTGIALGVFLSSLALAQSAQRSVPAAAASSDTYRAVVDQYCAGCHNDRVKSGGFSWNSVDLAHPERSAELMEKAIRKLRAGLMPPPGRPRPDATTVQNFAFFLETSIDHGAQNNPYIGRPALHRLNRSEYATSIKDLLGLTVDVSSLLPPDVMSHGFDNMADVLTT